MTLWNEHLQVKIPGQKFLLHDSRCHLQLPQWDFFLISFKTYYFILFHSILWGRLPGQRVDMKVQWDKWDWDAWGEIHKQSIESFFLKKHTWWFSPSGKSGKLAQIPIHQKQARLIKLIPAVFSFSEREVALLFTKPQKEGLPVFWEFLCWGIRKNVECLLHLHVTLL